MRSLGIVMMVVLGLLGCDSTAPCGDAGALESDAGPEDAGRPTLPAEELCILVANYGEPCALECPFVGESCDTDALARCLYLLEAQGDGCGNVASVFAAECATVCR